MKLFNIFITTFFIEMTSTLEWIYCPFSYIQKHSIVKVLIGTVDQALYKAHV